MPSAGRHDTLSEYLAAIGSKQQKGFWADADAYTISLLKAWWGEAASAENEWAYDYLPRLTGAHGTYETVMSMLKDEVEGYFLLGQNPAVGSAHGRMQRLGMSHLKWLVVRDLNMIESATWWKDSPEIESGELRTEDIETEVFFLPAATHVEKAGSFTQTQRLLQWRHQAVAPPESAERAAVLLRTGPADPGEARRLQRRTRPPAARPDLGLPHGRTRRSGRPRRCLPKSTAVTWLARMPASPSPHTLSSAPTVQRRPAVGSTPACTLTASTMPPTVSRARNRGRRLRNGAGHGRPTVGSSTTGRRQTPPVNRGASGRNTSGGIRNRANGSETTCPTSRLTGHRAVTRIPPRWTGRTQRR